MEASIQKVTCLVCKKPTATFRFRKDGHDIFRCVACGLLFVFPLPQSVSALYTAEYFFGAGKGFGYEDYDRDKDAMRPTFIHYLERIEEYVPQRGSLFDVGAATGYFVAEASKRGWQASGVELSDDIAARARSKGINIHAGTFESLGLPSASLDVVTAWDVLEHVFDPRTLLVEAHRTLKSEGVMAINTPDAGSLWARCWGKRWHLMIPPEHLFLFNRSNIRTLLEDVGFEAVVVSCIGKRFTLGYILRVLSQRISPLCYPTFLMKRAALLDRIQFPINLRDNMFVLAKKKQ